jgi:hypothetical protein
MTVDADVALPSAATLGARDLRDRLLANGFHEEFLGDARPPVTHYRLGQEDHSFYVEFLTPLIGSGYTRAKVPDFTGSWMDKGNTRLSRSGDR